MSDPWTICGERVLLTTPEHAKSGIFVDTGAWFARFVPTDAARCVT